MAKLILQKIELLKGTQAVETLQKEDFEANLKLDLKDKKIVFKGTLTTAGASKMTGKEIDKATITYKEKEEGTEVSSAAAAAGYIEAKKELTISADQADNKKLQVSFRGKLDIGEEGADKPAAKLSVRIGNINKNNDWIIDFSDKQDGPDEKGSSINVNSLLKWIGNKQDGNVPAIETDLSAFESKDGDETKDIKDFEITFEEFRYNITQKTYNFQVQSTKDSSLTIGNFTIKEIGFILTNDPEALQPATPALPEKETKLITG